MLRFQFGSQTACMPETTMPLGPRICCNGLTGIDGPLAHADNDYRVTALARVCPRSR